MGKSSKKRKRAEIIDADASSVVSEHAEEEESSAAMCVEEANDVNHLDSPKPEDVEEANDVNPLDSLKPEFIEEANDVNPLDSLKHEEYKRLVLKSLDDSIAMYERLESEGKKLPRARGVKADILSRLKESREVIEKGTEDTYGFANEAYPYHFICQYMTYYFLMPSWEDSPYEWLRINRFEEDGKLVLPGIEDLMDGPNSDYDWPTMKSHQYAILWDKLQSLLEKKEWDWNKKLDYANSVAETEKLDLLYGYNIKDCLEELGSQEDERVVQQFEYHQYLFKNEAENITDEEKLWMDVKEKFPLLNEYVFKYITNLFYPSGKKCEQKKLQEVMGGVENIYEWAMNFGNPLPAGRYYKLKQKLALKLGIVKYDNKGFLEDNYNSS